MKITFQVITKAELQELQAEASEVPFIYQGIPLLFRKARGKVLGIEFGQFTQAPEAPEELTLAGTFTPFRIKVWQELLNVERGNTLTYSQLAAHLGYHKATRAVASAVAANIFAYIIPCHRIVPASGGIGQYRWGQDQKSTLLTMEVGSSRSPQSAKK